MAAYRFSVDCPVPADQLFAMLTDFSDSRPDYFPNLSRKTYQVLERHDGVAVVREGAGPFWTIERYDFSAPGRIWSVVQDSNVLAPGGMIDMRIKPQNGRGSTIEVNIERRFVGWRGGVMRFSIATRGGGTRFFRWQLKRSLVAIMSARRRQTLNRGR
ncbi:MAG TPA: hypothetical protein VFB34_04285 [Chloroflexota bacterium]|nr:hypothetical protein [Chloroflexota bacterium]